MLYIITAMVAIAAFALVAYPLFQRKEEPELALQPQEAEVEDLHTRREAIYGAIKELDFEYQLGNLSQADYQDLRSQYRQRAASVLKEMDELAQPPPQRPDGQTRWEEEIEEAVRSLRAQGGKKPARAKGSGRFCPQCGASAGRESRFCAACGSPLARTCPACGAGLELEDNFCPLCGARVGKGTR